MSDKEKQIEEMAKEIESAKQRIWTNVRPRGEDEDYLWHSRAIAEHLEAQGYCKLPEGAVVLTREESEKTWEKGGSNTHALYQVISENTRKETAREIICEIKAFIYDNDNLMERLDIIAKQYGVEVEE